MTVSLVTVVLCILANMSNVEAETFTEWMGSTPPRYWLYIGTVSLTNFMLGGVNL